VIEVRQLTKSYRGRAVVRDVSFTVEPGSVTGLLGPNGSGKTTILRVALGLERASAGEVLIAGRRFGRLRTPYRDVGALLDASWVHPSRSAANHLRWIAQASGLGTGRVERALAEVGLDDVADQAAGTFSLGMKQRLGIATTVLGDPKVLVYDEPLNGLDPSGVEWFRSFLFHQAAAGRAVLLSSHLLAEVAMSTDRIVVLGRGEVVFDGPTDKAVGGGGIDVEFSGGLDDAELDEIERAVRERGWVWASVTRRRGRTSVRVEGAELSQVAAEMHRLGVDVTRIQEHGSLEETYRQLTEGRVEYAGTGNSRGGKE
jgi:ABC-2 type transport system ATP-binding protein